MLTAGKVKMTLEPGLVMKRLIAPRFTVPPELLYSSSQSGNFPPFSTLLSLLAASSLITTWAREALAKARKRKVHRRILPMGRERALLTKRDFTPSKYIKYLIMTNQLGPLNLALETLLP